MIVPVGYLPAKHVFTPYLSEKQQVNKFLGQLQTFAALKGFE